MTGEETFFSVVLSILVPSLVFESFAARVVVLAVVLVVVVFTVVVVVVVVVFGYMA